MGLGRWPGQGRGEGELAGAGKEPSWVVPARVRAAIDHVTLSAPRQRAVLLALPSLR